MNEKHRTLIVDDEPEIRDGVARWLNATGFETYCATDGIEGLEMIKTVKPDVVLLDVLMPNKGGLETLEELRACKDTPDIPVIMLSASLRDEQRALDAGATFFVNKPYDGKNLVTAVKASLQSKNISVQNK